MCLKYVSAHCLTQDACERGLFLRASDDNTGMVLDIHAACETLREVASAMEYLHNLDILHADLNGNNVLLVSCNRGSRRCTAKVCGVFYLVCGMVYKWWYQHDDTRHTHTSMHTPPCTHHSSPGV